MQDEIVIRKAVMADWEETMAMTWRTFLKFEAKDYGMEGVDSFRNFISDPLLRRMFLLGTYHMFVATYHEKIVGMVSLRNENHISLLFVDEMYHKRGIGRRLIDTIGEFSRPVSIFSTTTTYCSRWLFSEMVSSRGSPRRL